MNTNKVECKNKVEAFRIAAKRAKETNRVQAVYNPSRTMKWKVNPDGSIEKDKSY